MTTTFLLVRHAVHDGAAGRLAGRSPGIALSEAGRRQAARIADRLAGEAPAALRTSPQARARATAAPIAEATGLAPEDAEELDEVDFGRWDGQDFETLAADPAWRQWNEVRSVARTPGGEAAIDVQRRVLRLMERLGREHPGAAVVLVSHAEVIRAAIAYHLGLPVDAWLRLEVKPGSISRLEVGAWGARLAGLNEAVG